MNQQRTLAIIKPDAVGNGFSGKIIDRILSDGLQIVAMKLIHMSKKQAQGFYAVHVEKPFFDELTGFMSEGPALVMVLEGADAIRRWRDLMGATNPANAAEGTIRKVFAESITRNSVHGSDAPETASFEIGYFFNALEIVGGK